MSCISAARRAAFNILLAVEQGSGHSDDLLRTHAVSRLSALDRNLATALVLGVLRWQVRLDHQLKNFLSKPNAKFDCEVLLALRLGAFQITKMERIPARAAIDESVELAKQTGHRFAAGLVNAVLRKMAAQADVLRAQSGDATDSPAALALEFAHPLWLVKRWVERYGVEATRAICQHGQAQPALTVRLADAAVEAELAEAGISLAPGKLLFDARTVVGGDATETEALHEGRARLQDEGSQLIAELAAASAPQSKKILDACAAPGGKTLVLAERLPAARIVACEISPSRCTVLRKRLVGFGERIEVLCADAAALETTQNFDLILVDAPCSGTGTLGRNPEIRHRLKPEDFARQAERQRAILASALKTLSAGGRLLYSTCSLEPEENEQVVAAVLAASPEVRQLSLVVALDRLDVEKRFAPQAAEQLRAALTPEGALQLVPGAAPTDGFFAALLEKQG